MKIGVLGGSGREHALAWKLEQERGIGTVTWAQSEAEGEQLLRTGVVDLMVIGPEDLLAGGIADRYPGRVFGPGATSAKLESSKVWAKQFMGRHGVATAAHWIFTGVSTARAFMADWDGPCVVKYDGLALGKGVVVCEHMGEALAALDAFEQKFGPDCGLVVEELLEGLEVSVMGVTDGKNICLLPPSRDYKRAFDGDAGPNTGGMGAIAPVEVDIQAIQKSIITPTLLGLQEEGLTYPGFLYFGVMLTEAGPRLLEYNVRLGNPEAQVVLPALKSDLAPLIQAAMQGDLSTRQCQVRDEVVAGVVLVSGGYPSKSETGQMISGLPSLEPSTLVFHSGTEVLDGHLVTSGGRVLTLVCRGDSLSDTLERVYSECAKVYFEGMHYRHDIGRESPITCSA